MKKNPSQLRAIAHLSGPMMVLAGPGSGKTSVIVERTSYMIHPHQVPETGILVVTFSKAAAREMKERFLRLENRSGSGVTFGTFHGVFYGILKCAYGLDARNILSEEQKKQFLGELVEQYGEELRQEGEFLEELGREISMVKGNRVELEYYYSKNCPDEIFRKIYLGYQKKCRALRLLDFDDMLLNTWELLRERTDIRRAWQERFPYILVDEFQDINPVQYDVIRLLAEPRKNLFIVGDDDQSIYHFRGARPQIMMNFEKDYPGTQKVLLNVNYRCTEEILNSAMRMIKHNKNRFPKKLSTPNEKGCPVQICQLEQPRQQSLFVLKDLQKFVEAGGSLEDAAVLFRTNLEAENMVNVLMEFHLPFTMKERLPDLYEHWICRNLLDYMEMAQGDMSRKRFLAVMNRPNRYISREAVYEKRVSLESLRMYYEEKEWMCDRIDLLEEQLKLLRQMKPYAAVNFIRHGIGYEEYLRDYAAYRKIKSEELFELLDRIQESTKGMDSLEQWKEHMEDYGNKLKEQAARQSQKSEGVTISTLHSVKGLEYERVYILNVNEGSIPYKKAVLEEQLEEERRLFYVGMTRARKKLFLCYVTHQFEKERERSRFLEEVEN